MPHSSQTPDDFICRPAGFLDYRIDGSVEKTFVIRGEWTLIGSPPIGELVVHDGVNGPLIKIHMEVKQ